MLINTKIAMFKRLILIVIIILSIPNTFAEIISTDSMNVIESRLEKADKDTLVIFDVDDVLLYPHDAILQSPNKFYRKELQESIDSRFDKAKAEELYSVIMLERKNANIDDRMPKLISDVQKKGVKALILTRCFTGKFGNISNMVDWRIKEISSFGYDFEKSWQGLEAKNFKKFQELAHGRAPIFKKGMIFTSGVDKGLILKEFLNYSKFVPKTIVFIDDKKSNLESVNKLSEDFGIEFLGIEYTASLKFTKKLDKDLAYKQFKFLEKTHHWYSDEEVISDPK